MPVDPKLRLFFLPRSCKVDLRHFSAEDKPAANGQLLFEHPKFFEAPWKIKSDSVLVNLPLQVDLDFKPHRHICTSACEIFLFNKLAYAVRASSDFLKNLQ